MHMCIVEVASLKVVVYESEDEKDSTTKKHTDSHNKMKTKTKTPKTLLMRAKMTKAHLRSGLTVVRRLSRAGLIMEARILFDHIIRCMFLKQYILQHHMNSKQVNLMMCAKILRVTPTKQELTII